MVDGDRRIASSSGDLCCPDPSAGKILKYNPMKGYRVATAWVPVRGESGHTLVEQVTARQLAAVAAATSRARSAVEPRGRCETITMDRAAPDPAPGHPLPKDEGILWLPAAPTEGRDGEDWSVYGPCSILPVRRQEAMTLIIEEGDASLDFSRRITPATGRTPRGDPLVSLMTGACRS